MMQFFFYKKWAELCGCGRKWTEMSGCGRQWTEIFRPFHTATHMSTAVQRATAYFRALGMTESPNAYGSVAFLIGLGGRKYGLALMPEDDGQALTFMVSDGNGTRMRVTDALLNAVNERNAGGLMGVWSVNAREGLRFVVCAPQEPAGPSDRAMAHHLQHILVELRDMSNIADALGVRFGQPIRADDNGVRVRR